MTTSPHQTRRHYLLAASAALLCPSSLLFAARATPSIATAEAQLAALEKAAGGRLGVAAWRADGGKRIAHRSEERFPLCSTFKAMLAAAVLARSANDEELLGKSVRYRADELVAYSPVTVSSRPLSIFTTRSTR